MKSSEQYQTDLWSKYVNGDIEAFQEIYIPYHKKLTLYCLGRIKDLVDAENIASEVLIKLFQLERPSELKNFEQWIFVCARNSCNSYWAKKKRRRGIDSLISVFKRTSVSNEAENYLENQDLDQVIKSSLGEKENLIWTMHQQGYNNQEIAEVVQSSSKTVANLKASARQKIKNALKDYSQHG